MLSLHAILSDTIGWLTNARQCTAKMASVASPAAIKPKTSHIGFQYKRMAMKLMHSQAANYRLPADPSKDAF